jgi:hypothetical protein
VRVVLEYSGRRAVLDLLPALRQVTPDSGVI